MRYALLVLAVVVLAGCANLPATIDALAKDPATVCGTLSTPWGTQTFARTNITTGSVECGPLKVEAPGQTQLPVTVVPTASDKPLPVTIK